MKTVSAAEANRGFSSLLRQVGQGETVLITSHGRPVAKLVPADDATAGPVDRQAAMERLMEHLRSQPGWDAQEWTREELYDDEPYPESFK
jgi:prevent-host-death family protein